MYATDTTETGGLVLGYGYKVANTHQALFAQELISRVFVMSGVLTGIRPRRTSTGCSSSDALKPAGLGLGGTT